MLTSHNKMAYEYFMAYCLLQGQIGRFSKYLYRLDEFNYTRIPRHFEEAALICTQVTGRQDILPTGTKLSEETVRKFLDFNRILKKYDMNRQKAYPELEKKYKDTYWFYSWYYYHPEEQ